MSDSKSTGQPSPANPPFAILGGAEAVRTLVDRFYDLMDTDPAYAPLRALHPASLAGSREKLYLFLSGWFGGPDLYVEQYGHPKLRWRHLPFSIGTAERDQWVDCMFRAMDDCQVPAALREHLRTSFFNTADFMRNREEPPTVA